MKINNALKRERLIKTAVFNFGRRCLFDSLSSSLELDRARANPSRSSASTRKERAKGAPSAAAFSLHLAALLLEIVDATRNSPAQAGDETRRCARYAANANVIRCDGDENNATSPRVAYATPGEERGRTGGTRGWLCKTPRLATGRIAKWQRAGLLYVQEIYRPWPFRRAKGRPRSLWQQTGGSQPPTLLFPRMQAVGPSLTPSLRQVIPLHRPAASRTPIFFCIQPPHPPPPPSPRSRRCAVIFFVLRALESPRSLADPVCCGSPCRRRNSRRRTKGRVARINTHTHTHDFPPRDIVIDLSRRLSARRIGERVETREGAICKRVSIVLRAACKGIFVTFSRGIIYFTANSDNRRNHNDEPVTEMGRAFASLIKESRKLLSCLLIDNPIESA